jgi:hypothetical protein
MVGVKRIAAVILCLLLAGCQTPSGGGFSIWRAETWNGRDAAQEVERSQDRQDEQRSILVGNAHTSVVAADIALASDPQPSRQSVVARGFTGDAVRSLDTARGNLTPEAVRTVTETVENLTSDDERRRAIGERDRERMQDEATRAAERLRREEEKTADLTGKLGAAYQANAELADKYRRLWFVIYAIGGLWLLWQFLPLLAIAFPPIAPFANGLAALGNPAEAIAKRQIAQAKAAAEAAAALTNATLAKLVEHIEAKKAAPDDEVVTIDLRDVARKMDRSEKAVVKSIRNSH